MFSIFIYLFFAGSCFLASGYFYRFFKKNANENYREFFFFFLFLGIGMFLYPAALLMSQPIMGIVIEIASFLIVFSFAFVFRAFLRFQQISAISFTIVPVIFGVIAMTKLLLALALGMFAAPVILDNLIYWHYPLFHSAFFGVFVAVFTFSMSFILFVNIVNVQKNKKVLLFLGLGFFTGGIGGVFVHSFNDFFPLALGYVALFMCPIFFLLSFSKKYS